MKKITIAALVLTTACIGVKRAVMVELSSDPVPPEEVDIFLPEDDIPEDCERIALLAAAGDYGMADFGDLLQKLREAAGELGANAIDIEFMSEAGTWERMDPISAGESQGVRWGWQRRDARAFALYCPSGTGPVR